jgi:anti-repressor protein
MNELIKIENKKGIETVNARDLHEFLEVKTKFSDWIKSRIEKFSFEENTDFVKVSVKKDTLGGSQQSIEYHISIELLKLNTMEKTDLINPHFVHKIKFVFKV